MEYNVFEALGKSDRLEIIELLRKNPRSVNELASLLNLKQPHTSKELKVLADAGVVEVRKEAQTHIYSLSPVKFREIDEWIEKYRAIWEQRFDKLDKLLAKEKKKSKMKEVIKNGKHKI